MHYTHGRYFSLTRSGIPLSSFRTECNLPYEGIRIETLKFMLFETYIKYIVADVEFDERCVP